MIRRNLLAMAALAAVAALPPAAQAAEDKALKAAIAGPQRAAEHVARDAARHPYETLTFWGVKPKQTILEVAPGSGYWTEILAPYAKATGGTYIATAADLNNPTLSDAAKKSRAAFEAKYADEAKFGKISYAGFGATSGPLGAAGSADMVITARNIHNWMWQPGMLDKAMKDFHAVLKTGGVLAVEEHRSDPRPQVADARDGYVSVANVVAAAEKAGFRLAAQSEVNANPKDTKDYSGGVWMLPPVRRAPAADKPDPKYDRAKLDAIGESDRMTLRFVKR